MYRLGCFSKCDNTSQQGFANENQKVFPEKVFPGNACRGVGTAEAGMLLSVFWGVGVGSSLVLFSNPEGMDVVTYPRPSFLQDGCTWWQLDFFTLQIWMLSLQDSFSCGQFKIKFKVCFHYWLNARLKLFSTELKSGGYCSVFKISASTSIVKFSNCVFFDILSLDTWSSGGLCCVRFVVGLDDLKDHFQSIQFYDLLMCLYSTLSQIYNNI